MGAATYAGVAEDYMKWLIHGTAAHFALHVEHENWMHAQVMALPEEAQEKYMHKGHGKKEHDDEMMEFVQQTTGYFTI